MADMSQIVKTIATALTIVVSATSIMPHLIRADSNSDGRRIMVSMGDSYSSGEGIQPFYHQNDELSQKVKNHDWLAHRSQAAWAGRLVLPGVSGEMRKYRYDESEGDSVKDKNWFFVASSGAKTKHFKNKQRKDYSKDSYKGFEELDPQFKIFDKLDKDPDYVTLTLGGNDAGFEDIIENAVLDLNFCKPTKLTDGLNKVWKDYYRVDGIRDKLDETYRKINEKTHNNSCIIVAGYPKLINSECLVGNPLFDPEEANIINENVTLFNKHIERIVDDCKDYAQMNIHFVSVEKAFEGHEAYSMDPYINGVIFGANKQDLKDIQAVSSYSMHPNSKGAAEYAKCVQKLINKIENGDLDVAPTTTDSSNPIPTDSNNTTQTNVTDATIIQNAINEGDTFFFGSYKNDPIEWKVLDIDEKGRLLIISTKVIDFKMYYDIPEEVKLKKQLIEDGLYKGLYMSYIDSDDKASVDWYNGINKKGVIWETSTIRTWLNNEFYKEAFNDNERSKIFATNLWNDYQSKYNDPSPETVDNIFLLSEEEYNRYAKHLDDYDARMTEPVKEMLANEVNGYFEDKSRVQEVMDELEKNCPWWLRTPVDNLTALVTYDKTQYIASVIGNGGIRPAMWIDSEGRAAPKQVVKPNNDEVITIGSTLTMGNYRHDDIEWQVLDIDENGNLFVLSKKILEYKRYHRKSGLINWEDCSLRRWLNEEFYYKAFNSEEQGRIMSSSVDYSVTLNDNNHISYLPASYCEDKIFLLGDYSDLSYLDMYYGHDYKCDISDPLKYRKTRDISSEDYQGWWLRGPGYKYEKSDKNKCTYINTKGEALTEDLYICLGVRPAMWIKGDSFNVSSKLTYRKFGNVMSKYNYYGRSYDATEGCHITAYYSNVDDGSFAEGEEYASYELYLESKDAKNEFESHFKNKYEFEENNGKTYSIDKSDRCIIVQSDGVYEIEILDDDTVVYVGTGNPNNDSINKLKAMIDDLGYGDLYKTAKFDSTVKTINVKVQEDNIPSEISADEFSDLLENENLVVEPYDDSSENLVKKLYAHNEDESVQCYYMEYEKSKFAEDEFSRILLEDGERDEIDNVYNNFEVIKFDFKTYGDYCDVYFLTGNVIIRARGSLSNVKHTYEMLNLYEHVKWFI